MKKRNIFSPSQARRKNESNFRAVTRRCFYLNFLKIKTSSSEIKRENFENLFKPDFQNLIEVQGCARQLWNAALRRLKKNYNRRVASKIVQNIS